jgi:hypothetical protein
MDGSNRSGGSGGGGNPTHQPLQPHHYNNNQTSNTSGSNHNNNSHITFAEGTNYGESSNNNNGSNKSLDPNHVSHKKSTESQRQLKIEAAQVLHPGTTLTTDQWEMIEDDLLPFEIMAIFISLGAFTLIGISIHVFTSGTVAFIGTTYFNGLGYGAGWIFLLSIPAIVGIVQIGLAILFSGAAALEKWEHASIQDVIRHHLPTKVEHYAEALPLHCTAKGAYVALMIIFILCQIIAAGIAIIVNDTIEAKADAGDSGSDVSGGGGSGSGLISDVLSYTAIVFNECCDSQGWSKQGPIKSCEEKDARNCTLPDTYKPLSSKLCTCHPFGAQAAPSMRKYVNSSGLCTAMKQSEIPISDTDKIPGTTIGIRFLIRQRVYQIPLVGSDEDEFGCGIGFFRGFQWGIANWATSTFRPYFIALMIVSCIQLGFLGLGYIFVCRVRHKVFKYDEEGNVLAVDPASMNATPRLGLRGIADQIRNGTFSPAQLLFSPRVRARSRSGSSSNNNNALNSPNNRLVAMDPLKLATTSPISSSNTNNIPPNTMLVSNNPLASPSISNSKSNNNEPKHLLSGEIMVELSKPSGSGKHVGGDHINNNNTLPGLTSPEMLKEAAKPTSQQHHQNNNNVSVVATSVAVPKNIDNLL